MIQLYSHTDAHTYMQTHTYTLLILFHYMLLSEKAMAPHSSALAWKIPWTEGPGGLRSMGSRRVGHNSATSLSVFTFMQWRRKWQPTAVFLPGDWKKKKERKKKKEISPRKTFLLLSVINPRDGGAWWAAVYGVAQSRTRLKQLSSSSIGYYKTLSRISWGCTVIPCYLAGIP